MKLYYDLHMHSCLSPCGDRDMTPNNIVNMSLLKELDVIALSDHNSAKNIQAVRKVAEGTGLLVIPAIEVCTMEEVHILCLFYSFEQCEAFGKYLYDLLPPVMNQPDIFGEQWVMNEQDEVVGSVDKLLINAASLSIDRLLSVLPEYGGFAIPAHVDKSSYSIIANLGFLPPEYGFPCIEVKNPPFSGDFSGRIITDSDAHYLEHIAERERFLEVPEKTIRAVIDTLRS
ncbi:PHP domain-containing protein [Massiliimalia timonensis]|uniref:PHP domain-containing protein n=1 Tax=Massiliimalia timonensis TaxID=1987501 RepID=UPI000B8AA295|nr:PHP domain-containing protein [Massiliimalia timonensis]MBS7175069.1 PHP domain-containing protein [Clostridiales bacterium]